MKETFEGRQFKKSVFSVLIFVFLIWLVKSIEFATDADFSSFGILPRTLHGSIGILTSPFIHGDIYHLFSNTIPITILGVGVLYFYPRIGLKIIILIYLMTGFWVWVAARDAFHIGASGLIYGLFGFLLTSGFIRRDRQTLAISFAVLVLYGGSMFYGFFPTNTGISWESHLMGFIAGLFCAVYFRNEPMLFNSNKSDVIGIERDTAEDEAINFTGDTSSDYQYYFKPKRKTKGDL